MKLSYFDDTDTLYLEFNDEKVSETKDLDENTILDYDNSGRVVSITFEHASERTDVSHLLVSGIAAQKLIARLSNFHLSVLHQVGNKLK